MVHIKIISMRVFFILFAALSIYIAGNGQTIPAFKQLRYEEDYSYLKDDSVKSWYEAAKYNAISADKRTYLSIGGDIRYQYLWFKNENWECTQKIQ